MTPTLRLTGLLATASLLLSANALFGAVTPAGDTFPSTGDAFWTSNGDDNTDFRVGVNSSGSLLIDGGSTFESRNGYIASPNASGSITVTGEDTSWINRLDVFMTDTGGSTLTVADGAEFYSKRNVLIYNGSVGVTGSSSSYRSGNRTTIQNNSSLTLDGASFFAGTLEVDEGTVTLSNAAQFNFNSGLANSGASDVFVGDRDNDTRVGLLRLNNTSFSVNSVLSVNQVSMLELNNNSTIDTSHLRSDASSLSGDGGQINANALSGDGYATLNFSSNNGMASITEGNIVINVVGTGTNNSVINVLGTSFSVTNDDLKVGQVRISTDQSVEVAGPGGKLTTNTLYADSNSSVTVTDTSLDVTEIAGFSDMSTLILSNGVVNVTELQMHADQLDGNGTINTNGLVGSGFERLVFNGTNTASIIQPTNSGDVELTVVADGQGYLGTNMDITNGAVINTVISGRFGHVGIADSSGEVIDITVGGVGTVWTSTSISVGQNGFGSDEPGKATILIEDGAAFFPSSVQISNGNVEVTGSGTALNTNSISTGFFGNDDGSDAVLSVSGGASVNVKDDIWLATGDRIIVTVDGQTAINVGTDGTGNFINDGEVLIFSIGSLAAGTYMPITVGSESGAFSGTGTYEAFGGTWDDVNHTFTVANIIDATGGVTNQDLSGQRLNFDGSTGVIASFQGDAGVASFDAVPLPSEVINNQWGLATYGFTTDITGTDVLISIYIGEGYDENFLSVYHRDDENSPWTEYVTSDFVYSDGYASFTVDGFSDYAITVPESSTYGLLAGLCVLLVVVIRRRRA